VILNYTDFAERIKGLKPSPVYLFTGEERYFIDEGVKTISDRFLEKSLKDFNYGIYSAQDIDVSRVIEIAETLPVMSEYRVLIVKGINEWNAKERDSISSYTENSSSGTCLILTAIKLDKREKFFKSIEKNGIVILCNPFYKPQLNNWIKQQVNHAGKTIDNDALSILTDYAGYDMLTLRNDIEKLLLYCADRKDISINDVTLVSSNIRSVSVFEVVNALIERRYKDAIRFLKKAVDEGEPPVRVFYFIVKDIRMLLKARTLLDAGKSFEDAAKSAGVPAFKVKDFSQRVKRFPKEELYNLFEKLVVFDSRLKGGALRPELVLEDLIFSMNISKDR